MTQAVSRRSLTAEARVRSQFSPCEIFVGEEVLLRHVFLRVLQFFPVYIIPPMLHTHLHLYVALTRRTNGRSLGTFQIAVLFRQSGSIG